MNNPSLIYRRKLPNFFTIISGPAGQGAGIIIAFIVAGIVVWVSGGNPLLAYGALAKGAFGSLSGFQNTIRYTLPIIFLGFSFAVCARCGYFNIGQDGQMYAAALAITVIQVVFSHLHTPILLPLMIIAAVIAGGIICLVPAALKFMFGVNEIVVGMLLNYIVLLLTNYMLMYSPLGQKGKSTPMSIDIAPSISGGILLVCAVCIIIVYTILMRKSVPGFRLRMVGNNIKFAKTTGIKTSRLILIVSFIGGAFSALSIAGEMFGIYHRIYNGFTGSLGFYGMTAALIGGDSVIGLIFGALILGALQSGAVTLAVTTNVPSEMVLVVQGFVMLFATINIFAKFLNKKQITAAE